VILIYDLQPLVSVSVGCSC